MDFIGYKKVSGNLTSSATNFAAAGAAAYAAANAARAAGSAGLDLQADIALAMAAVQFGGDLWNQWTSHPAADARDFIKNLKPKLAAADPYNRMVLLIAGDTKINHRAKDVSAKELVLWYRGNYPDDYKTLRVEDKKYFNDYLESAAQGSTDVNQASRDYQAAKFTTAEINSNATPAQAASNIFSSATSGKTNWLLYGAIGIGIVVLLKYFKK
jgi:hypothetical protein